jgi:hypothetical protein
MTFSSDTLRRSSIGTRLKLSFWNWSLFQEMQSVRKQAKHSGEKRKKSTYSALNRRKAASSITAVLFHRVQTSRGIEYGLSRVKAAQVSMNRCRACTL